VKRVKSACICQTLVFSQKPEFGFSKDRSSRINHEEFEHYKAAMDSKRTKYLIVDAVDQEDGSLVVKVKKQYNLTTDTSEYFD